VERTLILTKDGSHSIAVPALRANYHSLHGAVQESQHVFIEAGLRHWWQTHSGAPVSILEMGFGTGLNALLTYMEAEITKQPVHYTAIEPYPLTMGEIAGLNYCSHLGRTDLLPVFYQLHQCDWESEQSLGENFILCKKKTALAELRSDRLFDIVYYDAFAPVAQPELWTAKIFEHTASLMKEGAVLVTYCSKGVVRRALQKAGFSVEKIPGPPGKREIVRAVKQTG
jgi:tRNA U34 5-methylaminomethyl-2-thiouridine-forming methyltransferase MnmC